MSRKRAYQTPKQHKHITSGTQVPVTEIPTPNLFHSAPVAVSTSFASPGFKNIHTQNRKHGF